MALIIALGSNQGDSLKLLQSASELLSQNFNFLFASRIYQSKAVDYEDQPDFFNQVIQYDLPSCSPQEALSLLLEIEKKLGRKRIVKFGPRTIDLDLIFWGNLRMKTDDLILPHPRWMERSFVVRPLQELPFFKTVEKSLRIPTSFEVDAFPIS
jgi:2-amino-4-hydroxy-6-hydroxymethyldihydropteridine diphosphokinase